jgi:hypothetical protein
MLGRREEHWYSTDEFNLSSPAAMPPAVLEGSEGAKKSVPQIESIDRSPHLWCPQCGKAPPSRGVSSLRRGCAAVATDFESRSS